ncbi:MAG: tetratricopeptide repeat protein [Patescibacteria group bacterium]|nr:MAG: tetratricopeptide repeat protein [Patescibacteria group bacterium]
MSEHSPVFGGGADDTLVTPAEGRKLAAFADAVARWTIYVSLALIPLFYFPGLGDVLELPKQTALILVTVVAVLAWLGKMLVTRRLEVRGSIMNLLVGVYVLMYVGAVWFSKSRYISIVGDFGQEKSGLVTVFCFALLYFVANNVLRDAKDVKKALDWVMLGALLILVQALAQAFGLKLLPGASGGNAAFNTVGTTNAVGVYAAMAMALVMGRMLMPSKKESLSIVRKVLMCAILAMGAVYIAALQFWALWLMLIIGCAVLVAYGMLKTDRDLRITMLAIPMAAMVIGALFIFIRFPFSLGLPAEVMPSLSASWNISREALASQPLFGSGPGTFLYDYTQFRSKDLNATDFWSVQFDRSTSRILTMLATLGILGLASFLVMAGFLMAYTKLKLWRGHDEWLVTLAVFSAWVTLLFGKVFYSSNMTLEFAFWMLTAMLVSQQWHGRFEARFDQSPRAALGLSFMFIVAVIFSIAGVYLQGQRLVAASYYQRGITTDVTTKEGADAAAQQLLRATQLNGRNDLYFRALSQALAVQANRIAAEAGANPTDDQARQVTILAANAVNAGRRATDLNPSNVQTWSSLAGMYRDLGPAVDGAIEAARDAYMRANELEPNNPIYLTELAKIELTVAEDARQKLGTGKDMQPEQKAAYEKTIKEAQQKAREALEKALSLKQDYAAANYWMAILLQSEGKADEAASRLESVRNASPNDLGVGFQLAILYYQNKQVDKAIAELKRVIALEAQYSNARWYLAAMLEEKGDIDGAIVQIEEVLKANPNNADVQQRLAGLKAKKSGATAPEEEGLPDPVEPPQAP